jgi:hypothetical protein
VSPTDAEVLAVTADAVFVDKDRGDKASVVRRLDPRTGKTMWSRRVPRPTSGRVMRVDPATRQVVAEAQVDHIPSLIGLAAGADAVTVPRFDDALARFDPVTLAPLGVVDVVTDGTDVTTAPPGKWAATEDGLVAVDNPGTPVMRVRGVRGALAAGGTTLWVLDRGTGGLVRVQVG